MNPQKHIISLGAFLTVAILSLPCRVAAVSPAASYESHSRSPVVTGEALQPQAPLKESPGRSLKAPEAESMEVSVTYAGSALWQGTNAVAGDGNYAYSYPYFGLQVVDLSEPTTPVLVAELYQPAEARDILLDGNFLYVAAGYDGVFIFDVTVPTAPVLAGTISIEGLASGPSAEGLVLRNDTLYVSAFRLFLIVDVSNPYSPEIVNYFSPDGLAMNAVISGDYAYIAAEFFLEIWDVSDPLAPVYQGKLECGDTYDVVASGNYLYLALRDSGLCVVNASNPPNLFEVSKWIDSGPRYFEIETVGDYVYLVTSNLIRIFDIQYPYAPVYVADWEAYGFNRDIYITGDRAYIADWTVGFSRYDLSSPSEPVLEATYETPGMGYDLVVSDSFANDGIVYEANGIKGLQILDISDPETPTVISSYDTPGNAWAIDLKYDLVFLTDDTAGVMVINVADPYNPFLVGSCEVSGWPRDIVVVQNYAYVANGTQGFQVIDISDPQNPFLATSLPLSNAFRLAIQGEYAYVTSFTNGLHIIDISDPLAPLAAGVYGEGQNCQGVAVSGNVAYVSEDYEYVSAIDISNPHNPFLVGSCPGITFGYGMEIVGDYLYVAAIVDAFVILNISNPSDPYLAGGYVTNPGWAWDVDVVGENIFVTCDNGFLSLWKGDCAGPDNLGGFNIGDLTFMVDYLFRGGSAPQPLRDGDLNCDDGVDMADLTYLVDFLFRSGEPPCGGCI